MDLALELGMPFETMARSMTESEFRTWQRYVQKRMLPARRVELQLARICQLIAVTMGGAKDATVMDYMLHVADERPENADPEGDLEAAKEVFQFAPRVKRQVQE
jgi:hypothetical protein